jgi:hypothetical protein
MEDGKKSNAWAKQGDVNCEERGRGLGARRRNGGKRKERCFVCGRREWMGGCSSKVPSALRNFANSARILCDGQFCEVCCVQTF